MILHTPTIHVPLRTDENGAIRIGDTRVTLDVLIARHQQGNTPEAIHQSFPVIPLTDIYSVIAYYLAHQDELDAYLHQHNEAADQFRQKWEAEHPESFRLQARLRAGWEEKHRKAQD